MKRHLKMIVAAVIGVVAVAGVSLVLLGGNSPARAGIASSSAGMPTTQAQADQDIASTYPQFKAQTESQLPEPLLPTDQRTAWVNDWNEMASCMHQHGESWFPDAPSTFGDGKTPPPLVGGPPESSSDVSSSSFQAAQETCPLSTAGLNQSELNQATETWEQAHPTQSQIPPGSPAAISTTTTP